MDDRLDALAARARASAQWRSPPTALVVRTTDAAAFHPAAVGPAPATMMHEVGTGEGSRATDPPGGAASGWSHGRERTACWNWAGGEIALRVEEGAALGSWIVRGVAWMRNPDVAAMSLDWVCDDHVLMSFAPEHGVPFQIEEITGPNWHLELRLSDGDAFILGPPPPFGP